MVLAGRALVEAQSVDPLDQLHVAGHGKRGVLADPMERGEENAERQPLVIAGLCHVKPPLDDRSMGPTLTEATPCADHRAMTEAAPLPLARFTIVEVNDEKVPMCLRLATSLAARIAADLGAAVLKIEPTGGDPVRRAPPFLPQGGSALFQFLHTSKRALMLDLKTEAGRAPRAPRAE